MEKNYKTDINIHGFAVRMSKLLLGLAIVLLTLVIAQTSLAESDFDHDLTGFLLNGTHSRLKCDTCHKHGIFKGTAKNCQGCHGLSGLIATTKKTPNHVESGEQCDDCHTEVSWAGARMDHVAITGSCINCHNGIKAQGKNNGHISSHDRCDECHRTFAWIPARFDHAAITGTCFSCHNGTTARGKSQNHLQSSNTCEDCHRTVAWIPAGFDHSNVTGSCISCHDGTRAPGKTPNHISSANTCEDCHRTTAWIPATFDHASITTGCINCHNGTTAPGKNQGHITSGNNCEDCHRTIAWVPATTFDHSAVTPGTCISCHNGTTAVGTPTGHFGTSLQCDDCHTTTSFLNPNYTHNTMGLTHRATVTCRSCHTSNNSTITYTAPGYAPDCAACHSNNYQTGPHKKVDSPLISYTVSELRDCTTSCHIYTDNTFTTIEQRRDSRHRPTDGGW